MSEYDPNYVEVKNYFLLGVKVAVINAKNEVLLLRRSDKTPRAGGWDLPGGAVDANESPEDAAIRETVEETGIVIPSAKIITSLYVGERQDPWVLIGFSVSIDEVDVTLSWEHDEYRWVPLADIDSIELPEYYRQIVLAA